MRNARGLLHFGVDMRCGGRAKPYEWWESPTAVPRHSGLREVALNHCNRRLGCALQTKSQGFVHWRGPT
jgi:hypothetical protein